MMTIVGTTQAGLLLFVAMVIMLEVGRWLGRSWRERHPGATEIGAGAVEGAVFGLLGLLIAFTFSGAASRFDQRRALIVEEANHIGTAWLRIDLLPPQAQPAIRQKFREYVDTRIAVYRALPDVSAAEKQLARANAIQGEIWQLAIPAVQASPAPVTTVFLPAVNDMFDISNTRTWIARTHPPPVIYALLILLALCCALFAGYGMSSADRNWLYTLGFALVLSGAVFVISDLEYPRIGLIRLEGFDKAIVDVREAMH
jgi:hypothetical protein